MGIGWRELLSAPVSLNGVVVKQVESAKYLGPTISNSTSFTEHLHEKLQQLQKRMYVLFNMRKHGLGGDHIKLFYESCVQSSLLYAAPPSMVCIVDCGRFERS